MDIQMLITTMGNTDSELLEAMNLRNVSAVIANQTDQFSCKEFYLKDRNVKATVVSTASRGASLNRNTALVYSSGDIVVFADDDMIFEDGFAERVERDFQMHPDADGIKYYCESLNSQRQLSYRRPDQFSIAKKLNLMSAGVLALAVRKDFLDRSGLFFRNDLGPGRKYAFGEDSVFYSDMFRHRPRLYLSNELAAYVRQEDSSWFQGYDEAYFLTIGHIYRIIYGRFAALAAVRRVCKLRNKAEITYSVCSMLRLILQGIRES